MWFTGRQPAADSRKSATAASLRSSRLLLGYYGDGSRSVGGSMMGSQSRWGWSRSETERLVRLQAVVRGWLLRRKVNWIPARDLEAVLKDLDQRDKGLRRLVAYLVFFLLFFGILVLESDVTFQHSVETGMKKFINQVTSGPDGNIRLEDVSTREEFSAWALSLYMAMYDGNEVEDVCNACVALRAEGYNRNFFSEVSDSTWGTDVPYNASSSGSGGGNDSFPFLVDNCVLCYGSERASIVAGGAGSIGQEFCDICIGLEVCFLDDGCADVDQVVPVLGDVRGTNASLVKVFSNEDCYGNTTTETFPRAFWVNHGMTSTIANQSPEDEVVLLPTGRGYVANKNRMIGALLMDWTYYKEGECEGTYDPSFYDSCFRDQGSQENMLDDVQDARMNPLISVQVKEGRFGQGLVYSITTDIGVFDTGLNINLCGMLAILGGPDVMTDAVRSVSLRFNTYNGQCDGLFSFVDITARFTLGGEVTIMTSVEVFSMPFFFGSSPAIVGRAIAMFAFGLMLVIYIGKDVLRAWREVRGGRHRLSMSLRHVPVTTATALNLVGDCVFLWNLVLWVNVAVTAAKFELIPTLSYNNASEQVRAFSEELTLVALERWKRDAAAVAGSIFGLARLFIMLRFHPRLSLVTDVLTASAVHLVHFFIMFFMVVGVYSNLVWVIFGPSSLLFATWTTSFVTMTRIALGEFDNIYPLMVDIDGAAAFMIIVTYQTLQCILLLNIVISILLDAFQMVQKRNSVVAADTLWQTVMTTLGRWRIRLTHVGFALVHRCSSRTRRSSPRVSSSDDDDAGTTVVMNAMHDRHGGWKLRRRHQHTPPTGGGTSAAAATAAVAGAPVAPPGITGSSSRSAPSLPMSDKRKVSSKNRGGGATKRGGLTGGQRLAMSHRHYELRAAVEVLRRSPLPEAAVWRKMRQIIEARLGWVSEGAGNRGKPLQPGAAWGRSQSRRLSKR